MKIDIFSVTDKKYLDILYVQLATIKALKKEDTNITYYLLIDELQKDVSDYFKDLDTDTFKVICLQASKYKNQINPPVNSYLYYLRCLAPDIFPDLDKILYLDTDVIQMGQGLEQLWNTDLTNKYLAAAIDIEQSLRDEQERINVGKNYDNNNYFNTGVLLMNLKKWREDGYDKQIEDYLKCWPKTLKCTLFDQTLLNWIFKENVKIISTKYNNSILSMVKRDQVWYWKYYQTQNPLEKLKDIVFWHAKGTKPWFGCLSSWQQYQLPHRPLAKSVYFQLYKEFAKHQEF